MNADGFDDILVMVQGPDVVRVFYGGVAGFTAAPTDLPTPFPRLPKILREKKTTASETSTEMDIPTSR